ncbi:MAG: hypothetical protein OEW39_01955, partial [Deltaproteobacteria bacterium]|nr:hypothetical protein [Deltaproteobacteria bacterium]
MSELTPRHWLVIFISTMPWVRIPDGPLTFYPGHLALTLVLMALLWNETRLRAPAKALWPWLAAGAFIAGVSVLRGEYSVALTTAALTLAFFVWGVAAFLLASDRRSGESLREALLLLLATSLVVGLLTWAAQALWPPLCEVFPCQGGTTWPYLFQGGWLTPTQYLIFLLFLLPVLGLPLLESWTAGAGWRQRRSWNLLALLSLAAVVGLLAGAAPLTLALGLAAFALVAGAAWRGGALPLLGITARAALILAFCTVMFYGLFPGYLGALLAGEAPRRQVFLTPMGEIPNRISSQRPQHVPLSITNSGWVPLFAGAQNTWTLQAQLVLSDSLGRQVAVPVGSVAGDRTLAPGQTTLLEMDVRLPHWQPDGYLTWSVTDRQGQPVPSHSRSFPGLRIRNLGFRDPAQDTDNRLTQVSAQVRELSHLGYMQSLNAQDRHQGDDVLGSILDTLLFSPLWGLKPHQTHALALDMPRPLFPQILHRYGLLALALVLFALLRLGSGLWLLSTRERRGSETWLILLSLALLFLAGWFTPVVGSYH